MIAWRAEDNGLPPRFGRRARTWLARLLRVYLLEEGLRRRKWARDHVDEVITMYLQRASRYVEWSNASEYHGAGFSLGSWKFNRRATARDLAMHLAELERNLARTHDVERFPTLDDWLRADIAGSLLYAGDIGGTAAIPLELRRGNGRVTCHRGAENVLACGCCGQSFTGKEPNARTCSKCRAARREAVSRRIGRVVDWKAPVMCDGCPDSFVRDRANARFCPNCRRARLERMRGAV